MYPPKPGPNHSASCKTHRASRLVVVQVHHEAQIAPLLHHVDEVLRELVAELDVVRAASPLPVARPGARPTALRRDAAVVAAGTSVDGALAAGARDGVRYGGGRDGVDERRLSTSCEQQTPITRTSQMLQPEKLIGELG